jgi:hypothetical protein
LQAWTLSYTKNGDGYDISGNLTTTKISTGNSAYFGVPVCDRLESGESYQFDALFSDNQVSMSGRITSDQADLTFTLQSLSEDNRPIGAVVTYQFKGAAWKDGARLLTTAEKAAKDAAAKEAKDLRAEVMYPIIGFFSTVVLMSLFYLWFLCYGGREKMHKKAFKNAAKQNERNYELMHEMYPDGLPEHMKAWHQQVIAQITPAVQHQQEEQFPQTPERQEHRPEWQQPERIRQPQEHQPQQQQQQYRQYQPFRQHSILPRTRYDQHYSHRAPAPTYRNGRY